MKDVLSILKIKCFVDEVRGLRDAIDVYDFYDIDARYLEIDVVKNAEKLLTQRKEWEEMLETLLELSLQVVEIEDCLGSDLKDYSYNPKTSKRIKLIEKLTHKSWSEIRKELGR